jgi:hypothetical protein
MLRTTTGLETLSAPNALGNSAPRAAPQSEQRPKWEDAPADLAAGEADESSSDSGSFW